MHFYDIKPLLSPPIINLEYTIVLVILLVITYLILFSSNTPIKNKKNENSNAEIVSKPNILELLSKLEENTNLPKDKFYSQLHYIIKLIIENKFGKKVDSLTYSEINQLPIDDPIKDLLKATYFKEYQHIQDTPQIRKNYVRKLKTFIS